MSDTATMGYDLWSFDRARTNVFLRASCDIHLNYTFHYFRPETETKTKSGCHSRPENKHENETKYVISERFQCWLAIDLGL